VDALDNNSHGTTAAAATTTTTQMAAAAAATTTAMAAAAVDNDDDDDDDDGTNDHCDGDNDNGEDIQINPADQADSERSHLDEPGDGIIEGPRAQCNVKLAHTHREFPLPHVYLKLLNLVSSKNDIVRAISAR
jgi:hypothetical protein